MGVLQEKMGFCQQKHRCATGKREGAWLRRAWLEAVLDRKGLTFTHIFTTEINLVILVN